MQKIKPVYVDPREQGNLVTLAFMKTKNNDSKIICPYMASQTTVAQKAHTACLSQHNLGQSYFFICESEKKEFGYKSSKKRLKPPINIRPFTEVKSDCNYYILYDFSEK